LRARRALFLVTTDACAACSRANARAFTGISLTAARHHTPTSAFHTSTPLPARYLTVTGRARCGAGITSPRETNSAGCAYAHLALFTTSDRALGSAPVHLFFGWAVHLPAGAKRQIIDFASLGGATSSDVDGAQASYRAGGDARRHIMTLSPACAAQARA